MMHTKTILTKWTVRNKGILVLVSLFLNLTITQSAKSFANIVDLEGDKDGFGVGCPIANGLHFTDYGDIVQDYREPGDPDFTDNWISGDQSWTHTYNLMGHSPISASLEIYVAGIVDHSGWSADVLVNGVNIGTIPPLTSSYDITRILTFNVPVGLLDNPDGITIDLNNELDGYIIDYSQLSINTDSASGPSNDSCANAIPIGNVTNLAFDTTGATADGPTSSLFITGTKDIWYCYTATCTGTATISLCGGDPYFDSMLAVYSGCQCPATNARRIANDDDTCGYHPQITINVVCGNQYLIRIAGYNLSVGTGVLTVSCSGTPCTGPANDNCANAEAVGNVTDKTFSTTNATHDGPDTCILNSSPNIWYKYTATCTGELIIRVCGDFDTVLALHAGTSCSNLILTGCNDYPSVPFSCPQYSYQSEIKKNVTAGQTFWIEIGGFNVTDKGEGKLTISCGGQSQQASDLGDAPDSTNHSSSTMWTYDHTKVANFPTVYQGNAIKGPIHLNPKTAAYLGSTVTYEDEADQGYDEDPTNNIRPLAFSGADDRDLGDDGVVMHNDELLGKTIGMTHCQLAAFDYKVNVVNPNEDMWVNVWFDWNRDGDWNDSGLTDSKLNCASCNTGGVVKEWAVQNQLLYGLSAGLNTITTPAFLAWYPLEGENRKIWMRITLSEEPFKGGTGAAGSGPADGYEYGETEDYYFTPSEDCVACIDWDRSGTIDEYDLYTYLINYMYNWLDNCSIY